MNGQISKFCLFRVSFNVSETKALEERLNFCNVVTAAFLSACWSNAHELSIGLHAVDVVRAAVGDSTAQTAHQLLDDARDGTPARECVSKIL